MTSPAAAPLVVVAAVIERDESFLVTRRAAGTHLAGRWEFPGGKCEALESHAEALERELHEELDIAARIGDCVHAVTHPYADRTVSIYFYRCSFAGDPKPMLGQELAWVPRAHLRDLDFPEADAELVAMLRAAPPAAIPEISPR